MFQALGVSQVELGSCDRMLNKPFLIYINTYNLQSPKAYILSLHVVVCGTM